MPRKKISGADLSALTKGQRDVLMYGSTLNCYGPTFADVDELHEAWQLHRDQLTADFAKMHPGCRCFAWWKFTHARERPVINSRPDDADIARNYRAQTFGFLHTSIWLGQDDAGKMLDWQEPEHVYLRRHNLLTTAELAHPDLESESI